MELSNHTGDFVKGALIGSVLGSVAGLLFAPKSGHQLRDEIANGFHQVTEKGEQCASALKAKGEQLLHKNSETDKETFLMGGAVGAVIGAVAALLLAPKSGEELREALGEKYEQIRGKAEDFVSNMQDKGKHAVHEVEDQVGDWKETLTTLVDKLTHKKKGQSRFGEIVDCANAGLQLIQQLQAGR